MASTTSSVRSIRLPNAIWKQLAAEAAKRETTVNELMHSFAIVGLYKAAEGRAAAANAEQTAKPLKTKAKPTPKAAAPETPANPPKLDLPVLGQFERKPMQKTPKR